MQLESRWLELGSRICICHCRNFDNIRKRKLNCMTLDSCKSCCLIVAAANCQYPHCTLFKFMFVFICAMKDVRFYSYCHLQCACQPLASIPGDGGSQAPDGGSQDLILGNYVPRTAACCGSYGGSHAILHIA